MYHLNTMDDGNEEYLEEMLDELVDSVDEKFRIGQHEHGGNIWDIPPEKLAQATMEEAIDIFTYIYALKNQIDALIHQNKQLKQQIKFSKDSKIE